MKIYINISRKLLSVTDFEMESYSVSVGSKILVRNLSLRAASGDVVVVTGPNGVGKTSLFRTIMGDDKYRTSGRILLDGTDISQLSTNERAKKGIFLVFQEPIRVPGVSLNTMFGSKLSRVLDSDHDSDLKGLVLKLTDVNKARLDRDLNDGFSGGEKKKMELLQLVLASPKIALIDEIDSGMDAEGINLIIEVINYLRKNGAIVFIITHQHHWISFLNEHKVCDLSRVGNE